jgi:hypothetical protein
MERVLLVLFVERGIVPYETAGIAVAEEPPPPQLLPCRDPM